MELTVYSSAWCPDCREAKRFLAKHNIAYKEIDVQTTPGAIDEIVRRTGKRAIPQFVIDGEWVQPYRPGEGFLYEAMSKRLGIILRYISSVTSVYSVVSGFAPLRPQSETPGHHLRYRSQNPPQG